MSDPVPSYKEMYYRLAKAVKLADVLRAYGAFSWTIRESSDPDGVWNNAARLAGFAEDYSPSQPTREVALRLMMDREEIEKRIKEVVSASNRA